MKTFLMLIGAALIVVVPYILAFAGKMRVLWLLASVSLRETSARKYGAGYIVCMALATVFSLGGFILIVDQTLSFFSSEKKIMTKRTLKEVGKNPQPSDMIRLKEGECIIDLRVTHVGDGVVKLSRTTHDCIVDKAMFKALCEEREAQLLTENT